MKNIREYQICSKTVMDTSDPGIKFDENGICDHVKDFEKHIKPIWNPEGKKEELEKLLNEIKKDGLKKDFDCILGLSGGLDSSFLLHILVNEYNLKPLVFHVDAGWNSEIAVHNINVLVDKLGLDLYTEVINWEEVKNFQLALFKSGVPHLDIPQDHAFIATLYKFAKKHNIKYIINGGNFSTECIQYPIKYYYYGTDMKHIKDILRKFGKIKMKTYPFSSILNHKFYLKYIKKIKVVKPLNLMHYTKKEAIKILEQEYGWKKYPQKHFESRFTRFMEGYWLPKRFGFDPRRVMLSSLILTDQMTRNEALKILESPAYDEDFIKNDFKYIANKLEITESDLENYFFSPKKYYWDYQNSVKMFKIGARILNILGAEPTKKRNK